MFGVKFRGKGKKIHNLLDRNTNKSKKKKFNVYALLVKLAGYVTLFTSMQYIVVFIMSVLILFIGAACIINLFQPDEEDLLERYKINWDEYNCSCTFLTQEEIDTVRAGGQVQVGAGNSGSLNVTGDGVVSGEITGAHGKKITDASANPYDLPLYDGLTMDAQTLGCDSWTIDFNTNSMLQTLKSTYAVTQETRAHEGGTYKYVNYGPDAKPGSKLPYTEVDGRVSIAMTWRYNTKSGSQEGRTTYDSNEWNDVNVAGKYCDIVFDDGTVLATIFGSSKGAEDGASRYEHWAHYDGSVIEIVQWSDMEVKQGSQAQKYAYSANAVATLGVSGGDKGPYWKPLLGGKNIAKVVVYDVQYYKGGTYTKWFTEKSVQTSLQSTQTGTTASFGQVGSGQAVSNSEVIPGLSAAMSANANQVHQLLRSLGYSEAATLGIMGNIWRETGFNPNLWGSGSLPGKWADQRKTYYTVTQTNKSQIPAWINYLTTVGKDIDTIEGQIIGLNWTMSEGAESSCFRTYPASNYKTTLEAFKQLDDPVLACDYFAVAYERCTGGSDRSVTGPSGSLYQHLGDRKGYTEKLMEYYKFTPGSTSNAGSLSTNVSTGISNAGVTVNSSTLKYTNGEKVKLDPSWTYANESVINSGAATYYTATGTPKNICIAVNAGHGCSGVGSKQTKSHPDGTGKVTGGTNANGAVMSCAISTGMAWSNNDTEAMANLKVAQSMKETLLSRGYDVLMIRDGADEQLDNIARTVISNNVADVHVAIHFDSSDSDKGVYYMSVPDVASYKAMEPVKSTWQEHGPLGEALVAGVVGQGFHKWNSGSHPTDLTQTSYSTIPSIDIELGDHASPHGDDVCKKLGIGLADGIEEYFKSHQPKNQASRGLSATGGSSDAGTSGGTDNGANSGSGGSAKGIINKNLNNLRTSCRMKEEGICGCYISDPNCMCHVFAGDDGVIGTSDDKLGTTSGEGEENVAGSGELSDSGGNMEGLTPEQAKVIESCRVTLLAYMDALKVKLPVNYEAGWTWKSGERPPGCIPEDSSLGSNGPWYGQSNHTAHWYISPTVNGVVYNSARNDCSSYASGVLKTLGAEWASASWASGAYAVGSDAWNAARADDRFIVISGPNLESQLQPGDICANPGTHVEIVYKIIDTNTDMYEAYSYGGTISVQNCFDCNTRQLLAEPKAGANGHYNRISTIIRYVGSGGAGK